MRHLMSPLDFSVEELDKLLDLAQDIEAHPAKYAHACAGKKLATLFYEPSTRTRLSHEAAMLNLGGSIMGFSSADSSSAAKGESVSDTIRTISCYADTPESPPHPQGTIQSEWIPRFLSHQATRFWRGCKTAALLFQGK